MILSSFPLIFCLFCSVIDGKSCYSIRKSISTSERRAEHPFAGRNTQQLQQLAKMFFSFFMSYLIFQQQRLLFLMYSILEYIKCYVTRQKAELSHFFTTIVSSVSQGIFVFYSK